MYKTQKENKIFINNFKYCKGCSLCVEICPKKCLALKDNNRGVYGNNTVECNIDLCIQCRACERICPDGAIKIGD